MSTYIPEIQITADQLKAIKTADRFYMHLKTDSATIVAIKERDKVKAGPFESQDGDLRYEFAVNHSTHETAGFLVYAGKYAPIGCVQAVRLILRVGDEVHLRARTNGNGYCEQAGLFVDELLLTIRRNGKTILHELVIGYSITPDNTARSITSDGRNYSLTA